MQTQKTTRGFSVRAFSEGLKRRLSPKGKEIQQPKGILRNNSIESITCVYCDQNNNNRSYTGTDTLRSRIGNIPGCQTCAAMNTDNSSKKSVRFNTVVRERNYIRSDEENPTNRKYRKVSSDYNSAKTTKPCFQAALFVCSICHITMKTESEFITHQRKHGMNNTQIFQYQMPHQYQDYRPISPHMFVRQ